MSSSGDRGATLFCSYLDWLCARGVEFVSNGLREPDYDGPLIEGDEPTRNWTLDGLRAFVEHRDPRRHLGADHATASVARALVDRIRPGEAVWDIGCGTGVLAVVAALAGAGRVVGTDIDPRALELARRTGRSIPLPIEWRQGSLLDPIASGEQAGLVLANLPHKPARMGGGLPTAQAGGDEGDSVHGAFVKQTLPRIAQGARILFFLHSLPHPRLLRLYAHHFSLQLLSWKCRSLGPGEYGSLQEEFLRRAGQGKSFVVQRAGRVFFIACVWLAVRR